MMQLLELMQNRRSTRSFTDQPLSAEELHTIVEAGRWAPTAGNCQSVHFTVITTPAVLEELRRLVRESFAAMTPSPEQYISIRHSIALSQKGNYTYDYGAPVLVVVSNRKGYPNAQADSSCALQNMMLMAEGLSLGSCWINQLHWLEEVPALRSCLATLGIAEDEVICGAVALGHPDRTQPRKPRTGMPVDYV